MAMNVFPGHVCHVSCSRPWITLYRHRTCSVAMVCLIAIEHGLWPLNNMFYGHGTCSMAIEHVL